MNRRWITLIVLVGAVALVSGCAQPQVQTVVDPKLKQENEDLKSRLGALDGEKDDLQQKLRTSELDARTARLDAEKWQKLYDEA